MNLLYNFLKDEAGATAIEYALIAVLISTAAIIGMSTLGKNLTSSFNSTATQVSR